MSKRVEVCPLQHRLLAMADQSGLQGIRLTDAVARELALLPDDQRTKSRKRIITANVCHALLKLVRRNLLAVFHAPSERYYVSTSVLQWEDTIRNTAPPISQTCELMIVDEPRSADPQSNSKPVEDQPSTPQTPEEWLAIIQRGCAVAATSKGRGN
jgi:hypothetical protein